MNRKAIVLSALMLTIGSSYNAMAQETAPEQPERKNGWEIGIGGNMFQTSRYSVLSFGKNATDGYSLHTSKRDVMFGGELYLARELHPNLAIDLQGVFGFSQDPIATGKTNRWIGMGTLGLQWRLGKYWGTGVIDPFLRIGAGYMYKNYTVAYTGKEALQNVPADANKEMSWQFAHNYNKSGADRNGVIPIAFGAGVHMWVNDNFGLGIQGDYLYLPYKQVANIPQVAVRLMWRWGGSSLQPAPTVQYVDRVIEKVVEVPAKQEVAPAIPVAPATTPGTAPATTTLCDLFGNIHFDFDDHRLSDANNDLLDRIANVMIEHADRRYLIVGYTDARGTVDYNIRLGQRRADEVKKALVARGVNEAILKTKSAGKHAAFIKAADKNEVRRGDRKVIVEIITNMEYWDRL